MDVMEQMDDDLAYFLVEIKMEHLKPIFQQHKVYSMETVKMISDIQFESMGLAIGEIAKIKASISSEKKEAEMCKAQKEERIRSLVDKIKKNVSKDGKQKSQAACSQVVKKKVQKQKMFLGWLHRSTNSSRYKQVRLKDGGGVRELTYNVDKEVTVDLLKNEARKFFFPEEVSKFGAASDMCFDLGNYAQEKITSFTDTDGKTCTFQEYLTSWGLFSSRFKVYLMSTFTGEDAVSQSQSSSKEQASARQLMDSYDNKDTSGGKNVFMGAEKTQLSGDFENLTMASTPKTSVEAEEDQRPPLMLRDQAAHFTDERENHLAITYENLTQSSYSEVVLRAITFSRSDCYDLHSFNDPTIQDVKLQDFDPLDYGFTIVDISKREKCFVERINEILDEKEEFKVVFPQANGQCGSLILHPPSEVWGYDGKQLTLGVVASCHMSTRAWYVWYRDGIKIKEGNKHCCLLVTSPGSYIAEVHNGEEKEASEPVVVCNLSDVAGTSNNSASIAASMENISQLPVVEKEEINFAFKDEIGRGSYGVVYKGTWAGTDVAVKHVKIRNAKRLRSVMDTEVRFHSMARHPNIVQIMAISYLKNSIYLVSELIEGRNLDEILFRDDERTEPIQSYNKCNVGKQICQAVAYLHNLKPPMVHRDIKPANVLVAKETHITKLCDMGLSKLKSAQSLSQTVSTSIPGTPSYMAPECLLERKKATVHSNIWSLACTLVELFTEKDCWEQLVEEKKEASGKQSDDLDSDVQLLIAVMRKQELPRAIESLAATNGAFLERILKKCLSYDMTKRASAIDIINTFS